MHRKDCQHTWHKKLDHRDPEAIKYMEMKNLATDLKITDCGIRGVCKTCVKGKMTRQPFPKMSFSKTQEPLDLIHTDVCGPMQTKTPGNKRYILTLIDDYSKYTVVYLMEYKSEVTEKIQDYVRNMKTKFKKVPKVIRSDRSREYVNASLKDFLRKEGIEVQYTVGYVPEQNGTAKRKNRYLLEMARCMLIESGLANKYWGEAVSTANYLQNRLYTRATGTTPFERWYGKKPSLQHVHTFGSIAYAHVPKELRRKLDEKAKEFVFVGYAENAKGYRLLDTSTNKITLL
ncbi:Copia protein [Cyphomyrmex costatus]|uniref:Copia protein n=1 Tax=Cyphomyrmex costatus TaxID=456900 RepID=A0A151I891_9HYME|nr:Copia protein [Cyphomyrmex costatus]